MLLSSFIQDQRIIAQSVCWLIMMMVCGTSSAISAADRDNRPNVVFILADDLGYTDVACYGSKYYQTPHIDKLAAQGMRFTDGHTCGPNCQPTRAALMSGQYGPRTGIYTVGEIGRFDWQTRPLKPADNVTKLDTKIVTVAEALKKHGYKTGMFGKWHLGEDDEHHPSQQGFDEAISTAGKHFDFATKPKVDYPKGTYLADFLTDKAVDFIERHQREPFFLYLPHFGVHSPHHAKADLIEKFKKLPPHDGHKDPTYAAMIASVDESVGRVLAKLDELKLAENTLVIFSSDNGGVGGYERWGINGGSITDNLPLHGGKGMLYEGGHRVPYIFRMPGKIAAGSTNDNTIISVDLYPTLLALTGAKAPANQSLDGESLWPLLTGTAKQLQRTAVYWHFPGYLGAGGDTWRTMPVSVIRSGDWKLLHFIEDDRVELYNLKDDLGETKDLSNAQPEQAKQLLTQLKTWRTTINAPMPTPNKMVQEKPPGAGKGKGKNKAKAKSEAE